MDSKSLMISDWVNTPNGISKVIYIAKYSGIYTDNTNDSEKLYSPHEINPIPLTPEILEKNGFTRTQYYDELLIQGWQIQNDCEGLRARHEKGWCLHIQCKCVHELQHALRLCGIDKEIVL